MEISRNRAECWLYEETSVDNPVKGEFYGWCKRIKSFYHPRCGKYFSTWRERHNCIHWSIGHEKRMKNYTIDVRKGLKQKK